MDIQMDILLFLQSIRSDFLNMLFLMFSISAEVIIVFITAIVYWCINKKFGQKILFSLCGNIALNSFIKEFVRAPRPIGSPGLKSLRVETAGGYSFPSMHTHMATTFWISISNCFKKKFLYVIAFIMIVGVGVSRLYLAVHWPVDVLFGWIFGIIFTILLGKVFDYVDGTKNYTPMILMFIAFFVYVLFIQSHEFLKMFGVYTGFIIGYIVEDKYINFSTDLSRKSRPGVIGGKYGRFSSRRSVKELAEMYVKRLVFGLFTLGALYIILKFLTVFITGNLGLEFLSWILDYTRYAAVVFYAIAGAPALFKVIKLD
ncbi:phosphatase PAP2 family protein [Metaclostridioides mangenotii]|uniref:Membrane-associated phospholipid phosphatase n=1 Tax=Metaclostridioides mangenotii TaxID=1540 RepID=A0ABS4EA95_9FIRM|nr:phosphatase PAP2 family protein [Clostridioides mangenotii]MBP1854859.1 membrane-associated phospholipid phosphatase [Clostridioides mangenotii]